MKNSNCSAESPRHPPLLAGCWISYVHFTCRRRTQRHEERCACVRLGGWVAGLLGPWVGWWVPGWMGVVMTPRKSLPSWEKCREHSLAILTTVKFLCQKSPRLPALQFHSDWRRSGEKKKEGREEGWGAGGVWVARLKERRNGG